MSDYTLLRATDAPDFTGDAPGAFYGYGRALGAEQVSLNIRVLAPHTAHVAPGGDPTRGHSHRTIEEIYLVLNGELTAKLGEHVVTLSRWDAVRIPPATPRAVRNDSDDEAALLIVSIRVDDHARRVQQSRSLLAGVAPAGGPVAPPLLARHARRCGASRRLT